MSRRSRGRPKGGGAILAQPFHKLGRRCRSQQALGPRFGCVEDCAILGHDAVEDIKPGHDKNEVIELAPGDQDQAAVAGAWAFEGGEVWVGHAAVMRDRTVIVGGECDAVLEVTSPGSAPSSRDDLMTPIRQGVGQGLGPQYRRRPAQRAQSARVPGGDWDVAWAHAGGVNLDFGGDPGCAQ